MRHLLMVGADTCTQSLLRVIILVLFACILLFGDACAIGGLGLHGAEVLNISPINPNAIRHIDILHFGLSIIVETSRPEEFL